MARLPRMVAPGCAHLVIQRGHPGRPIFRDDADRETYLRMLRDAAGTGQVALHAFALADNEVLLVATPPDAPALSRLMQAVGRHYVSAYNRRHGGSGTLWDGRFRCGVLESGPTLLRALHLVDSAPGRTSAPHRAGGPRETFLADPAEYWQLGNTPFEREAAYRTLLGHPLPPAEAQRLRAAALGGWVAGSREFAEALAAAAGRPAQPRPRGRPRKS
ncbi:MAG: transposase [Rubrivivax sp.]